MREATRRFHSNRAPSLTASVNVCPGYCASALSCHTAGCSEGDRGGVGVGGDDLVMTVPKYIAFQWERKVGQHFKYGMFHECRLGGVLREVICKKM